MMDLFTHPQFLQARELKRVTGKIGPAVLTFLRQRGVGGTFHASDLHKFVGSSVAPASADRILRDLRKSGECNYDVLNRRQSHYRVSAIKGA
jgi:hypothetical protein